MKSIFNRDGGHYNIFRIEKNCIDHIKTIFPEGNANELNFVLFSTSGVHGTYVTIEEVEINRRLGLTFLIIQPRLVTMQYGELRNLSDEDILYLKKLRESSKIAIHSIG